MRNSIICILTITLIIFQCKNNKAKKFSFNERINNLPKGYFFVSLDSAYANPEKVKVYDAGHQVNCESFGVVIDYNALQSIGKLQNMHTLILEGLSLDSLPKSIGLLKNLKKLNISRNELTFLPRSFKNLSNLRYLNISLNKFKSFPVELTKFKKLETLIYNWGGTSLNNQENLKLLAKLEGLHELHLKHTTLGEFPADMSNLKNLEVFYIQDSYPPHSKYKLNILNNIKGLKNLKKLSISYLKSFDFNANISALESLKYLDIFHVGIGNKREIVVIPNEIGKLKELKEFYITESNVKELPVGIFNLSSLEVLEIHNLENITLLDSIENMQNLETLILSGKVLNKIPDNLSKLKKLNYLGLYVTEISKIPKSLMSCRNLTELHLGLGNLSTLPKDIIRLRKLKKLSLSHGGVTMNGFKTFPEIITELNNLEELSFSSFNISKIPDSITKLKKLKKMNLDFNKISDEEQRRVRDLLPNVEIYFGTQNL